MAAPMVEARVSGIPCLLRVDYFKHQPPMGPRADSDWDCYGWTDINYTVCDRRGRPAPWLERKVTPTEHSELESLILEEMTS